MRKYLNQIIVIPIGALYYLIGLFVINRLGISVDYAIYGFFVICGLTLRLLGRKIQNKKLCKAIYAIVLIAIALFIYLKPILILARGIYLWIVNGNFTYAEESISRISSIELLKNTIYYFSLIFIMLFYEELIVKKKISSLLYIAIFLSAVCGFLLSKIDLLTVSIFVLALLLKVFNDSYNDINLLDYRKSIIVILLFICCTVFSYFVIPYVENINIRENIIIIKNGISNYIENLFKGDELSLDGNLSNMELLLQNDKLSEDIILTIDTSYHVDRIKAYSCSTFDETKNSFVIDKKIIKNSDKDFTDLFIKQDGRDLTEYFHVVTNKKIDNVVYVPYGELSFLQKINLYDDSVIQFEKKDDYNDYTLTFNPYFYDDSQTNLSLLSKYREYVNENYSNTNSIPKDIIVSINKFIGENPELYYGGLNDNQSIESKDNKKAIIENINNYINEKFIIKDSYERNEEKINDVSYALENNHEANNQLLATILTFLYRNEGIPSRLVVGYSVNDYQDNTVYIHENDKTYWSEVFINNRWIPAEKEYLIDDNQKVVKQEYKIGSMDGSIDEDYDNFSKTDKNNIDKTVLTIESNYDIDRIKQTSYGDYNPEKQMFEYEENIDNYSSIQNIKRISPLDKYFVGLFISGLKLNYYMKVTSYIDTNNAFVPYGLINIQDASMYQDKSFLLNGNVDSYLVNFEPYNKENSFKTNSFYEDYVYEKYLNVPDDMIEDLKTFLFSKGIDYSSKDKSLLIRQIKNLLQSSEYSYTLKPGKVPDGEDVLMYFLINNKKGFCQHFAGVATLLYRVCGIPSRYTVGFMIDDFENGVANLSAADAHAWVEVYTKNYGWKPIEVTGSKRFANNDVDIEFDVSNTDNNFNSNSLTDKKDFFNTQPESALEKQNSYQNKTYVKENDYDDENKILLTIETDEEIKRIKGFSLGNYDINNQKFYLGEDISNRKEIIKIKQLYDIDSFFKSLFITDNELNNEMIIKIYDDNKWLYVPYGVINIDDASIYQDKYMYFENEDKYDDYSLSYSSNEFDRKTNLFYDYENFVYNYYTTVPYDFEFLLKDFLEEKNIDINSEDKLSIIKRIQELFVNKYLYKDKVKKVEDGTDPVLNFIIRSREGDDNLFAYGTTLLLRLCDIPTRVVNGFYLDNYNEGKYEVYSSNSHSWIEVYTSNYGWMPVEVCPKYEGENIDEYQFERHYNEEDDIEFVDIQKKNNSKLYLFLSGSTALLCVIGVLCIEIKKKRNQFKERMAELGITTKEQLQLLININKNYLLLKNNGYANEEIEQIMLRIRFSPRKETEEDLKTILKQVDYMKKDIRNNRRTRIKK